MSALPADDVQEVRVKPRGPLVPMGPPLSPHRLARYSRQLALPEFNEDAQRRLASARVLVIGAGGLGSATIPYLASAGVGTIGIVDNDTVELSNLHRQTAHGMADLGRRKLDSLADTVRTIDPEIHVELHDVRLDSSNALGIVTGYDLLIDGSDNFPTRYLTNDAAILAGKPLVWGAILRYYGQVGVAWSEHGPSYRDLFPAPPPAGSVPSCEEGGVLPSVCAVIGAILCSETIKIITGIGEPLIGRVTSYDALSGRFREIEYGASDEVGPVTELIDYQAFCGVPREQDDAASTTPTGDTIDSRELAEWLSSGTPVQVVDVREPFERAIAAIEPSVLIPLGELGDQLDEVRREIPVVVYCHHGVRSETALRILQHAGFTNARHLIGGIEDFAVTRDPTMARY